MYGAVNFKLRGARDERLMGENRLMREALKPFPKCFGERPSYLLVQNLASLLNWSIGRVNKTINRMIQTIVDRRRIAEWYEKQAEKKE